MQQRVRRGLLMVLVLLAARTADAQPTPGSHFTLNGYAEGSYSWNFNDPSNGVTNLRVFDDHHNQPTLDNLVLDAAWTLGPTQGRLALQLGHTPDTYYAAEPFGDAVVKYIQQANLGWRPTSERPFLVEGGIFLSPVGPEAIAVKDQWNWSHSNLFYALPYYHAGVRFSYSFSDRWTASLAGFNGWSDIEDNNAPKAVAAQATYTVTDRLTLNLLYLGGIERDDGAPEGPAWRSLFDVNATWSPDAHMSFLAHFDTGFEPNRMGVSWWVAGALYARFHLVRPLYLALRGDVFYESVAVDDRGTHARAMFWPVDWVSSQTVTLDARPVDNISLRLEVRNDIANGPAYYRGAVPQRADGTARPNAASQDTVTLGFTAWF